MYPARLAGPPQPGQGGFKSSLNETCDRIKEEFAYMQSQYHSLKLELDKLANDKTDMQRHYVMYYEMSYGLNVEMHKQTEIAKRLNAIIGQILPYLNSEHQQQVAQAVERAKQVTMAELNAIIGQQHSGINHLMQQLHAQQLPSVLPAAVAAGNIAGHGPVLPMMAHPGLAAGLQPPPAKDSTTVRELNDTKNRSGNNYSPVDIDRNRRSHSPEPKKKKDHVSYLPPLQIFQK